ncbi:MAG TPA: hypothetical protein VHQ22_21845 [Terriglobales bacterium]|nr:hypothetical protein [Terriglobales bacterium]
MNCKFIIIGLLTLATANTRGSQNSAPSRATLNTKPESRANTFSKQQPNQRQETWYEFMLKQFNPENKDYGRWIEDRRRVFIASRIRNPYFAYTVCMSVGILVVTTVCVKLRIDHRRAMWITAEMMADVYNQDAYSRQIAHEAIDRYNKHIERCNRAIEAGESSATSAVSNEIEQLRAELMRLAEERDTAIRERDLAREEVRRKSEILADMSVRLEALTLKSAGASVPNAPSGLRGADPKLITHINNLQEQLYAERNANRRLKGG